MVSRRPWGFTGGCAGYQPITFYSEGSWAAGCPMTTFWSYELMLITLMSSRPDPLCRMTGAQPGPGVSLCAPSGLNGIRMIT